MRNKLNDFHDDCMPFINSIKYYHGNETLKDVNFIGHCCIIDVNFDKKKRKLSSISKIDNTVSYPNSSTSYSHSVGGCLVLSEYNLIISHDESVMDVIGLGHDENIEPS